MKEHHKEHALSQMCRILGLSRSGYYEWLDRQGKPSPRATHRNMLDQQVKEMFLAKRGRAGSPRIMRHLHAIGHTYDKKTVANSMQRQDFRAKAARKFKATTNSKHNMPVADNILQQNFSATRPDQKWVSDITYLWTDEGWMYLAVVIDLYSRMVVGWAMSERMTAVLVIDALRSAIWRRKRPRGVIVHSDRGSQYCATDYQKLLRKYGLRCSMSAKGNCYDNACAESFFHSLKVEAIHGERFVTRESIHRSVFEYIEVDYNRTRLHSSNGYVSPADYEALKVA